MDWLKQLKINNKCHTHIVNTYGKEFRSKVNINDVVNAYTQAWKDCEGSRASNVVSKIAISEKLKNKIFDKVKPTVDDSLSPFVKLLGIQFVVNNYLSDDTMALMDSNGEVIGLVKVEDGN